MLTKRDICQAICEKIGLVRKKGGLEFLDKRELLHVSSALDLCKAVERQKDTSVKQALADLKHGLETGKFKTKKSMRAEVDRIIVILERQ